MMLAIESDSGEVKADELLPVLLSLLVPQVPKTLAENYPQKA